MTRTPWPAPHMVQNLAPASERKVALAQAINDRSRVRISRPTSFSITSIQAIAGMSTVCIFRTSGMRRPCTKDRFTQGENS